MAQNDKALALKCNTPHRVLRILLHVALGAYALNSTTPFTVDLGVFDRTVPTIQGHFLLTRLLLVLVFLHIAGVLRHQFSRGNVMRRMGVNPPSR